MKLDIDYKPLLLVPVLAAVALPLIGSPAEYSKSAISLSVAMV